ncbi:MAG: glycosyltransferase [Sterolibacterium sp.]|jgi:spore maturation protein CgeB|nr:glycosyltransferase [Sterolibacterium sp.]
MKVLCVLGRHNYGRVERGASYEAANFLPALKNIGHEVVLFDSWERECYGDFIELNRAFLATVEREQPDIIFCVLLGYELWLETLELAKQVSGACLINWATDDSWKYEEFSRWVAGAFDIYATTYRSALDKAQRDGYDHFFLTQWAAPASLLQAPKAAQDCRYPVSFVGAAYGNRLKWVEQLRQRGIEVNCFGHGWAGGVVASADVPRIINDSVISLNFGDSGLRLQGGRLQYTRQIKARVFEVPAAGGCLLTEPAENLDDYFSVGEDIALYQTLDELADKIHRLLESPQQRDHMAQSGHARVRDEHTYEARFNRLFERVAMVRATRVAKPLGNQVFEDLVARHRLSSGLRVLRRGLVWLGVVLWGRQRGPRAARRLLFELSWRVARRHTYTAAGWPGRLFYHES